MQLLTGQPFRSRWRGTAVACFPFAVAVYANVFVVERLFARFKLEPSFGEERRSRHPLGEPFSTLNQLP